MEDTDIFKEECLEILDEIEETLLGLQNTPADRELLNQLFRALHTIKGSGSMFGYVQVAEFCHELEEMVDSTRKGELLFSQALIDLFLESRDYLLNIIESPTPNSESLAQQGISLLENMQQAIAESGQPSPKEERRKNKRTNLKILIVEDEFSSRFILQDFLTTFGTTHVAIDGYEAVTALKKALSEKKPYDLVCLDIKMPGIDGTKVSEEIRRFESEAGAQEPLCRIVMTSGISDKETIDRMLKEKYCDLYLVKPVSLQKLAKFINETY